MTQTSSEPTARIKIGQQLPAGALEFLDGEGKLQRQDPAALFAECRGILFGVPAPFTPGCSQIHLPGYVERADELRARGFERIVCIAVSDAWVMRAWGEASAVKDTVQLLSDGGAHYSSSLGLTLDLTRFGMGLRCERFALIIDRGRVERVEVDAQAIKLTSAEHFCG